MTSEIRIVQVDRQLTAVVKVQSPMNKLPEAQRAARAKLAAALPSLDVGPLGSTCTRWRPPEGGTMAMEPGVIVARAFEPKGEIVASELPAGRAAHRVLKGSFEGLGAAWQSLFEQCAAQNLKLAGINWEIYRGEGADPSQQESALYALLA